MPMLAYASQAYHPSIGPLKKLEKVQKQATAWFYGYDISYKCRLIKSKLLPVSLYIELHDVFWSDPTLDSAKGFADVYRQKGLDRLGKMETIAKQRN